MGTNFVRTAGMLALLAVAGPGAVTAQTATGTIEGRVTDAAYGVALTHVSVTVAGTSLSTLTNMEGRYSLANVPAGEHTVKVVIIGYATQEQQVTVTAGQTSVADFALDIAEVNLNEIVATGVAGRVERRLRGVAFTCCAFSGGRVVFNTESYAHIAENDFKLVGASPLSTFSIDVDRASYANIRRFIQDGERPPIDAVRIEEMINYFPYEWGDVAGEHPFAVTTEVWEAPWKREHRLVRIGLHAESVDTEDLPPSNLVFLLDVSGSMMPVDKLPLLKKAFALLVEQLRPQDRVAIVVYAGAAGLVLPSTPGDRHSTILAALERLEAGGSTAGGEGLKLAYETARETTSKAATTGSSWPPMATSTSVRPATARWCG